MVSGIERHISALSRRRTIKQQASSQRPHLWQVHWKFVPSDSRVCTHIVEVSHYDLICYHDAKPQEAHHVSLDLRWVLYRPVGLKAKTMKLACLSSHLVEATLFRGFRIRPIMWKIFFFYRRPFMPGFCLTKEVSLIMWANKVPEQVFRAQMMPRHEFSRTKNIEARRLIFQMGNHR